MPKHEIYYSDSRLVMKDLPENSIDLIITSPPYADARKKHYEGVTVDEYPEWFMTFHSGMWRVLSDTGSLVVNIKDKVVDGVRNRYVWKTVMLLEGAGWKSTEDYLWYKTNAMPGYWPNRLRDEWEYCFHFTKQKKFNMYQDAVKKPRGDWAKKDSRNTEIREDSSLKSGFGITRDYGIRNDSLPGNVIKSPLVGRNTGHPAAFPSALPEFFIKLFTKEGDTVLDPFAGSGTTGEVCESLGRNYILVDTNPDYVALIKSKLEGKS